MSHATEQNLGEGTSQTNGVAPRAGGVLLVVGVVLLAFNLRPGVTGVPPLFSELTAVMGLSPLTLTWLAAVPVFCFAVFSAPAPALSRRFGEEVALGGSLAVLTAGLALRGLAPDSMLFPGTVLACAAIAVMNVLLTSLIKRRRPDQVGMLLGLYLLSLYVGAIIATGTSVPLAEATGGPGLALGIWALPAAVALVVWVPQLRHPRPVRTVGPTRVRIRVHRHALAWQVAFFMGLQSLNYFATLSWLPLLFEDRGASAAHAGFLVSMLGIGGVGTALVAPMLAQRRQSQRALITPIAVATAAGVIGALVAPMSTQVFWTGLLGLGQGAALGVGLYHTIARAATPAVAAALSAMSQGVGYLLAGVGPVVIGVLHTATDGWLAPIVTLLALVFVEWWCGMLAARPLTIAEDSPDVAA